MRIHGGGEARTRDSPRLKDLGLKQEGKSAAPCLTLPPWEGLKLVEITPGSPRFSLHGNDGKLEWGFQEQGTPSPGHGARSHQSPGILSPSQHPGTHLLAKKATQGKRRSWVSTKTFCTKRFGVQLCCNGNREKPELQPGQGGPAASTEHSLYKQAAFLVCPPHPAESCWNRLHARGES